ncbi:MAG: hypothetical protein NTW87_07885 [Planctomycetota bacterium]|nr:hypothetical protein [Planctomycetota bacterium]
MENARLGLGLLGSDSGGGMAPSTGWPMGARRGPTHLGVDDLSRVSGVKQETLQRLLDTHPALRRLRIRLNDDAEPAAVWGVCDEKVREVLSALDRLRFKQILRNEDYLAGRVPDAFTSQQRELFEIESRFPGAPDVP